MYSFYDLALFLLIYSFLGWAAEAGYYAVTRRRFCNRGVVALPLVLAYGFTFVLLMLLLPTLAGQHLLSFLSTMVVSAVVEHVSDGDIVLMHDLFASSSQAALQIVDALQAKGFCFVTVEQLMEARGVTPEAGARYRKIPPPA